MKDLEIDFYSDIQKLVPITWVYKTDPSEIRHIGYIAEDLNDIEAFKYVVYKDSKDRPAGIKYELLSVYAIEALKVAIEKIEDLENKVNLLEKQLIKNK